MDFYTLLFHEYLLFILFLYNDRSNLSRHVVDIHRSALEEFINKRSVFCFIFIKLFYNVAFYKC